VGLESLLDHGDWSSFGAAPSARPQQSLLQQKEKEKEKQRDSNQRSQGSNSSSSDNSTDDAEGLPSPNVGPPEGWVELNMDRDEITIMAQGCGIVAGCAVLFAGLGFAILMVAKNKLEKAGEGAETEAPLDEPLVGEDGKLPLSVRLAYCFPTVATLPVTALIAVFVLSFYSRRGADLPSMALAVAVARSIDVISDPVMSHLTDSCRSIVGRRKPFILVGAPLYGLFLVALLSPPFLRDVPLAIWFAIMYIGFFITNTITNIPYDAWGPELTEDSQERSKLFFMSGLFDGFGTLLAFCLPFAGFKVAKSFGFTEDICAESADVKLRCANGLTCVLYNENGPGYEWALNTTFRHFYTGMDQEIMKFHCETDSAKEFAKSSSDISAYVSYCDCLNLCTQACAGANRSWGFVITGMIFAVWYVMTAYLCCWFVKERPAPLDRKSPPLVPSMLNTLNNPAFRALLPAWACDAVSAAVFLALCPYFVMYVIAPEYQTKSDSNFSLDCKEGLLASSSSSHYDRRCNTMVVLGACVISALAAAVLATPFWLWLVRRKGKISAWLLWSLSMAVTNFLFCVLCKSWIIAAVVACALNGIPLAAKFLADSVLADIIDYDEFLTGDRNEAMYTMFKSFLPKVMAIPAAAIPLAVMNMMGHVPAVNGKIMYQPDAVRWSIRIMASVISGSASLAAWGLKRRYPLNTDEIVQQVTDGIRAHREGTAGKDPLSGLEYALTRFTQEENEAGVWDLAHFRGVEVIEGIEEDPETALKKLKNKTATHLFFAFMLAAGFFTGLCCTFTLLSNRSLSIIPTIMAVCMGGSKVTLIFCFCRHRAASALAKSPPTPEIVKKVLMHRRSLKLLEDARAEYEAPPGEEEGGGPSTPSAPPPAHKPSRRGRGEAPPPPAAEEPPSRSARSRRGGGAAAAEEPPAAEEGEGSPAGRGRSRRGREPAPPPEENEEEF